MTRILVVDGDMTSRTTLKRGLEARGQVVAVAPDGMSGLKLVVSTDPEVVLLCLGLPDIDGIRLLGMLRGASEVPVIALTAVDDDRLIVEALDAGADDCVVEPCSTDQIAARIRAVLRRSSKPEKPTCAVVVGDLRIDPRARIATLNGSELALARKEFDMLHLLATRAGEVVTKRDILTEVWQLPYGGGDRTVDVHLSWLRRKLGESAAEPRYLHSVRGVGVRLVDPTNHS